MFGLKINPFPAGLRQRKPNRDASFVSEESIKLDRCHTKTYKSVRKIT